jgi:phosphoglucomutase
MDAGRLSICGEESFGTGSDPVREKDGLWAVVGTFPRPVLSCLQTGIDTDVEISQFLAWLNILAAAEKKGIKGINGVLQDHYKKYGRTFFSRSVPIHIPRPSASAADAAAAPFNRYDYEEVESDKAQEVMKELETAYASPSFVGSTLSATSSSTSFKVKECGNFTYTDPIDKSVSKTQVLYTTFEDGSRFVVRLSGTGSQGATIRLYVEKYSKDESEYDRDTQEGLKPLIEVALAASKLVEHTGRKEPTVITVRPMSFFPLPSLPGLGVAPHLGFANVPADRTFALGLFSKRLLWKRL